MIAANKELADKMIAGFEAWAEEIGVNVERVVIDDSIKNKTSKFNFLIFSHLGFAYIIYSIY